MYSVHCTMHIINDCSRGILFQLPQSDIYRIVGTGKHAYYYTSFNPQNLRNAVKKVAKISITQIKIIELVCQNNLFCYFFDIPQILHV